jgi:hypothetical protein
MTRKAADLAGKKNSFFNKGGGRAFFRSGPQGLPFFSKGTPRPGIVQAKLSIGQPNDHYEREADHMADQVVQRKPIFESEVETPEDKVQRKCAACEKEEKQVQKKPDGSAQQTAAPHIESTLNASKGSGSPLPEQTRGQMESSFGADFSGVRIHNNNSAAQMSKGLNAQAFTHGSDIYFNSGKYDPDSKGGQHLLAHELTHTIQQDSGLRRKNTPSIQKDSTVDVDLVGPVDTYKVAQTGDVITTGEAAGPRILLKIELRSGETVTLTWYNFVFNKIETGDLRAWLQFRIFRMFYPDQMEFDALSSQLTPAQWRSLGNEPLLRLLEMHEKGTIHISDAVILTSYKGMIYVQAKATLDRNESQIDDLLSGGDRVKKIQEYSDGLREASQVRDSLQTKKGEITKIIEPKIAEIEHSLTQAHSFNFGLAGNLQNMDTFQRLKLLEREERLREPIKKIDEALEFWYQAFPLLTRLQTNEIRGENVESTLRVIKNNIVETRPRLDEALAGKGSLDLMDLQPIRQMVNANLGPKATSTIDQEDKRAARNSLIGGIALTLLGVALLFVPGGVFIDAAIGLAIAAKSINDAFVVGSAANTGLDVDDGLMSQAQASGAKFNAILSVIFAAIGVASASFKVLKLAKYYAAIGKVSPELSFSSKVGLARLLASNPELISNFKTSGELVEALGNLGVKVSPEELIALRSLMAQIHGVPRADVPVEKFKDYIFKEGAKHGKDRVFRSLGYDVSHSQDLAKIYELQGMSKFKAGAYTLGKLDGYGQRIDIVIDLQGIGPGSGKTSRLISGWMMREDSISLNTPFSGFPK